MKQVLKNFVMFEDGGAVVDMTMLMAALIGLAIAVMGQVSDGMEDLTGEVETVMIDRGVGPAWE